MPEIKVNVYKKPYENIFLLLTKKAAISITSSKIMSGRNRAGGTKFPVMNPSNDMANERVNARRIFGRVYRLESVYEFNILSLLVLMAFIAFSIKKKSSLALVFFPKTMIRDIRVLRMVIVKVSKEEKFFTLNSYSKFICIIT